MLDGWAELLVWYHSVSSVDRSHRNILLEIRQNFPKLNFVLQLSLDDLLSMDDWMNDCRMVGWSDDLAVSDWIVINAWTEIGWLDCWFTFDCSLQ